MHLLLPVNASADAAGSTLRYAKFVGKKHTNKKCARATLAVDTDANTMVITMPSSCLDSSKKIKMSAVSSSTDGSVTAEGSPIIALDDVFTDGSAEFDGVSDVIVRG
jgi:cytochrome c biogenesis factor